MADCLVYWKDCAAERPLFDSPEPGPWNFHYHTRQPGLFNQIKEGENLWVVVYDQQLPPGDWLLIARISVLEKRHQPEFERPFQIVGDPSASEFYDIENQSDLTPVLQQLNFILGKRITVEGASIGRSLQSIRPLTTSDGALLSNYAKSLVPVPKLV